MSRTKNSKNKLFKLISLARLNEIFGQDAKIPVTKDFARLIKSLKVDNKEQVILPIEEKKSIQFKII
jgi:hypothetical protein